MKEKLIFSVILFVSSISSMDFKINKKQQSPHEQVKFTLKVLLQNSQGCTNPYNEPYYVAWEYLKDLYKNHLTNNQTECPSLIAQALLEDFGLINNKKEIPLIVQQELKKMLSA